MITEKRKNRHKKSLNKKIFGDNGNISAVIVIAVIIIAVIASSVAVWQNGKRPPQEIYDFGKKTAHGIDVSEHNGNIDWSKVRESKDFAFIRVGYRGYGNGKVLEDKLARKNLKGAEKAKIPFGVYFYTQAVNEKEAREEANFVYKIIRHYNVSLPVIIDFEYPADSSGKATGRVVDAANDRLANTKIINAFINELQDKGYVSGLYASSSVMHNNISMKDIDKEAFVWVADYNKKVTYKLNYNIWQYSDKGKCDGVESEFVDLNYWYS